MKIKKAFINCLSIILCLFILAACAQKGGSQGSPVNMESPASNTSGNDEVGNETDISGTTSSPSPSGSSLPTEGSSPSSSPVATAESSDPTKSPEPTAESSSPSSTPSPSSEPSSSPKPEAQSPSPSPKPTNSGTKPQTPVNKSFPYLEKGVMPIGAYVGPPPANVNKGNPSYITEERYKEVKESGINIIYGLYERADSRIEDVLNAFDFAQANGIKYLPRDLRVLAGAEDADILNESMNAYKDKPGFIGNLVLDEPASARMEELGAAYANYKKSNPYSIFYINLLPTYASKNQLFINNTDGGGGPSTDADYERYLDDYIAKCNPAFISYDYYPLMGNFPALRSGYFKNMSMVRKTALENQIPFWVYIQSCSFGGTSRVPRKVEIDWQVNTALAYGSKGIQYFCYWTPYASATEFFSGALISKDGKKNETYFYVQEMNRQIAAIDEVLMNSTSEGVMALYKSPVPIPESDIINSYKELSSLSGDTPVLVGCFNYNNKAAYYVVNNTVDESGSVTLNFDKNVNVSVTQKAKAVQQSGSSVTLSLEPGEGVLVKLD